VKIVIVGVFPPFRGGIANFYETLAERLSNNHEVIAINFTTQYPNIFFPGKSQFIESESSTEFEADRILSSVNPLTWQGTANRIIEINPDLIIFKYWMPFFAPSFGTIIKKVKRNLNTKALVICDNIIPHEGRPLDKLLTKYFFNNIDYFIVMSRSVEADLLSLYPGADYLYTPHPLYDIFGASIQKDTAKISLGIREQKVLLYFGLIRPYKGLDLLINAAKLLIQKLDNYKILAIGDCYENPEPYSDLVKENGVSDVFDLRMEFVPNDKVNLYFSAADVVVLPYKSATQSGVVPIAYHFNKPVVVTDVGGLSEIVNDGKTGYVVQPDAGSIANGILQFYNDYERVDFADQIESYKQRFTWNEFIHQLENIIS